MNARVDLDAYFERIEWGGATRTNFDTLAGLLNAHMAHVPFENLDVLLGKPVRLDIDGLQDKLVLARRGGYCFEHCTLFAAVLEQLGFEPVSHTARVVLFATRSTSPRTHMFLKVPLAEGTFILDPGFGGLAPRIPVPLAEGREARVGSETHWMVRSGDYWVLRAHIGEKAVDGWVSTFDRDNQIDFDVGNHYTSTFSGSPFVNRIMMRALKKNGRVTVMNRDLTVWHGDEACTTQLADRAELRATLVEHFGFDLPEVENLRVPSIPEWA